MNVSHSDLDLTSKQYVTGHVNAGMLFALSCVWKEVTEKIVEMQNSKVRGTKMISR